MSKKCVVCGSVNIKKNGKARGKRWHRCLTRNHRALPRSAHGAGHGKQRYKCLECNRGFGDKVKLDNSRLWYKYTIKKQTYSQLAKDHNCSVKTIKRYLDQYEPTSTIIVNAVVPDTPVVLLIDTTYFGRKFGVMLFRDALTKADLLHMYVKHETNALYMQGIDELERMGYNIKAIICDGKSRLIQRLSAKYPVQMCHYHQASIIRRYLTKNPKTEAGIELKQIANLVKQTDKESLTAMLNDWHNKHKLFFNERTISPDTKRWNYAHRRLRSAYNSLKHNLPYLFTYQEYKDICIPNTTNSNEGHFSALKNMLRNHNGLSTARKIKMIDDFLKIKRKRRQNGQKTGKKPLHLSIRPHLWIRLRITSSHCVDCAKALFYIYVVFRNNIFKPFFDITKWLAWTILNEVKNLIKYKIG